MGFWISFSKFSVGALEVTPPLSGSFLPSAVMIKDGRVQSLLLNPAFIFSTLHVADP